MSYKSAARELADKLVIAAYQHQQMDVVLVEHEIQKAIDSAWLRSLAGIRACPNCCPRAGCEACHGDGFIVPRESREALDALLDAARADERGAVARRCIEIVVAEFFQRFSPNTDIDTTWRRAVDRIASEFKIAREIEGRGGRT